MRRSLLFQGFVLACSILSVGCTEILSGGKTYYLDEAGEETAGGDPEAPACDHGYTPCGGACVQVDSDARHCGACGHDCLGAACNAGLCVPQEVVDPIEDPIALAVDETHVYWTTAAGSVQRAPKAGGAIETIAAGQKAPDLIAVDGKRAFWLNQGDGTVVRRKVDGNGPIKVVFDGGVAGSLRGITLDDKNVYFNRVLVDGDIRRAGKGDDDVAVMLIGSQPEPSALGLVGDNVLWSGFIKPKDMRDTGGGYIRYMPRQGAADSVTLVEGEGEITALTSTGDTAVWFDSTAGAIRARHLSAAQTTTLADKQDVQGLAADSARVFWSTSNGNVKVHVLDAQQTRVLAFDIDSAGPIAADATHVYILRTGPGGGVLRVAK
jgi:Stigma-specific protein, Stig1